MKNVFRGGQFVIDPHVSPMSSDPKVVAPPNWKEGVTFSPKERDNLIGNYFAGKEIKCFPISLTDLKDLSRLSSTKDVMIQVENIDSPTDFKMYWKPYRLQDMTVEADYYFIIQDEFLFGQNPLDVPGGITFAAGTGVLGATLGKDDSGKYFVLVNNMTFSNDAGGGGDPPGIGAKIPTT